MSEQLTSTEPQRTEKPFPWRCPKCRQPAVNRVTMPYHCQRKLNGRFVKVKIPNLAVPCCSNCGEVVFDYVADEQIRAAFQTQLDADIKRYQTLIKYLFAGMFFLSFAMGVFFLFKGETVASLIFLVVTLFTLQSGAMVALSMRIKRIENNLMNHSSTITSSRGSDR